MAPRLHMPSIRSRQRSSNGDGRHNHRRSQPAAEPRTYRPRRTPPPDTTSFSLRSRLIREPARLHDQATQPQPVRVIARVAHHEHDLLHRRRIGRVAHAVEEDFAIASSSASDAAPTATAATTTAAAVNSKTLYTDRLSSGAELVPVGVTTVRAPHGATPPTVIAVADLLPSTPKVGAFDHR
jgi:hypothetical protein